MILDINLKLNVSLFPLITLNPKGKGDQGVYLGQLPVILLLTQLCHAQFTFHKRLKEPDLCSV